MSPGANKIQVQTAKTIVSLASSLLQQYFENETFLEKVNEWCGDEVKMLNNLKALASEIIEEAKQQDFNFEKNRLLMKTLAETLTSNRNIMSFEFKESGLLEALELYLTYTPQ